MNEAIKCLATMSCTQGAHFDLGSIQWFRAFQRKELSNALELSTHHQSWLRPFQSTALISYYWKRNERLHAALQLAAKAAPWRRAFNPDPMRTFFNLDRADHAFAAHEIDWNLKLTEPQVTKSIVKLLSDGENPLRAERISAFLKSLYIFDYEIEDLFNANIDSEWENIDIKIEFKNKGGDTIIIIIEAKIDHKFEKEQIDRYIDKVFLERGKYPDYNIILSKKDYTYKIKGGYKNIFIRNINWIQMWIKFERYRPEEKDVNLSLFQRLIWNQLFTLKLRRLR